MSHTALETTRNEAVTVGVTSVEVAPEQNGGRKVISMTNASAGAHKITINFGANPAVANNGIVLTVGQSVIDSKSEAYTPYQGVITAISDLAGGVLAVYER